MDVTVARNNSLLLNVTVTNADGSVRNITGGNLTFEVYDAPDRTTHKITGTATVVSGVAGTATAYLDDTDTDFNEYHVFYYIITLTELDNTVTDVQDGKLIIT